MSPETTVQVDFGEEGIPDDARTSADNDSDLDDYFASHQANRVVYQTSHFFLPQIHDLITSKRTINVRPEYQRRLRWSRAQKSARIESTRLLHKSWHVVVTQAPAFSVARAWRSSPSSLSLLFIDRIALPAGRMMRPAR